MSQQRPLRVLHILGGMTRGGVETWLMHVLRTIDREQFHLDFLVHTEQPQPYDEEVRALGSRIYPCPYTTNPVQYARHFKRLLHEGGPYDVVHSHVHHFSGFVLRQAEHAGVPIRIAHSHNDLSSVQARAHVPRRGYLALMEQWIARYATIGLAASRKSAMSLFGRNWAADGRWQVLHYGIDLAPFACTVDPVATRTALRLPPDAFVLGHVGRFVEQKNHGFLVDIAAAVAVQEPRMQLVLVGDGPLRPSIEQKVAQLGLSDHVVFAGLRHDIPALMLGAMDAFVFPSLFEGLGLVGIEAQAAGVPLILSDVIPEEIDVVKPLVRRLGLTEPAAAWADAVLATRSVRPIGQRDALSLLRSSTFTIRTCVDRLEDIYRGGPTATKGGQAPAASHAHASQ